MPGILPMKVIRVGSSAPARIAQACDRCRSKKIRCDGLRPTCSQCSNVGFECKTSDKLSRRAFPRGYTESLEERVRALENETRELKDLLDNREEKIDVLSKVQSGSPSRRASNDAAPSPSLSASAGKAATTVSVEQPRHLHSGPGHDPLFVGNSSTRSLADALIQKIEFSGRPCDSTKSDRLLHFQSPARPSVSIANEAWKPPPRLVTDQMVNVFFQEWAPLFPVLHRPSFLTIYEYYVTNPQRVPDRAAQVQLNLVFGIAALSNKQRITYDMGMVDTHWLNILDAFVKQTTFANLQCFVLAQLYCLQTGDYARLNYYKSQSVAMALSMGLHQSQASFALGTLVCESRKKVFWSIYCLDRFTAAILGQPLSISDDIIECEYPANVDDEYISDQGIQPALPGELTKLSSALELFKAVRILSRILKRLYPTSTTYEVSLEEVEDLEGELDRWLSDLPTHLHMQFVNDKPAAQSVNSRSPILLLAYHFIRSLILRPLATSLDCEHSCASTLALASSGKTTVQILRLLEERNLSFAFCVNRFDLLTSCGCSLLLEMLDLDLEHDSALLKDFRWELCTVVDMLSRHAAPSLPDFKHLACTVLPARRSTSTTTETPSSLFGASPELAVSVSPCDTTSPHSDAVLDSSSAVDARRGGSGAPSKSRTASSASLPAKKFRLIAPSTQRRRPSEGGSTSTRAPTKTPSLCDSASSVKSVKSPGVNLDYFVIPPDHVRSAVPCSASSERHSSAALMSASPSSPCWDRLFEGMSHAREGREDVPNRLHLDERGAGPEMEGEWPTFTDLLSPLQEHGGAAAVASPRVGGGKSHSMVSFSGESLASSDELGTYDFVAVDGDSDAVIAAAAAAATALADEGEDSPMDGIALEV